MMSISSLPPQDIWIENLTSPQTSVVSIMDPHKEKVIQEAQAAQCCPGSVNLYKKYETDEEHALENAGHALWALGHCPSYTISQDTLIRCVDMFPMIAFQYTSKSIPADLLEKLALKQPWYALHYGHGYLPDALFRKLACDMPWTALNIDDIRVTEKFRKELKSLL